MTRFDFCVCNEVILAHRLDFGVQLEIEFSLGVLFVLLESKLECIFI